MTAAAFPGVRRFEQSQLSGSGCTPGPSLVCEPVRLRPVLGVTPSRKWLWRRRTRQSVADGLASPVLWWPLRIGHCRVWTEVGENVRETYWFPIVLARSQMLPWPVTEPILVAHPVLPYGAVLLTEAELTNL